MKIRNCKFLAGFTLVELLVVTGIILLLTALILPNFRSGERQFALQRSANKLSQDIRRAQQMAMSAKEFQGSIPLGGYGVCLNTSPASRRLHYYLFADKDNDQTFDGEPTDGLVEDVYFEKGVQIESLNPAPFVDIMFIPPDPTTIFSPSSTTATIELKNDLGQTKTITVNKAGLIEIK